MTASRTTPVTALEPELRGWTTGTDGPPGRMGRPHPPGDDPPRPRSSSPPDPNERDRKHFPPGDPPGKRESNNCASRPEPPGSHGKLNSNGVYRNKVEPPGNEGRRKPAGNGFDRGHLGDRERPQLTLLHNTTENRSRLPLPNNTGNQPPKQTSGYWRVRSVAGAKGSSGPWPSRRRHSFIQPPSDEFIHKGNGPPGRPPDEPRSMSHLIFS